MSNRRRYTRRLRSIPKRTLKVKEKIKMPIAQRREMPQPPLVSRALRRAGYAVPSSMIERERIAVWADTQRKKRREKKDDLAP